MILANRRILAGFATVLTMMVLTGSPAQGQVTRLFGDGVSLKFLPLYHASGKRDARWDALAEKGLALLDERKFEEAVAPLLEALKTGCNDGVVLFACGYVQSRAGKGAEAAACLAKAEVALRDIPALRTLRVLSLHGIGHLYAFDGDWEHAYEASVAETALWFGRNTLEHEIAEQKSLAYTLGRAMVLSGEHAPIGDMEWIGVNDRAYPGKAANPIWGIQVRSAVYLYSLSNWQASYFPQVKELLAGAMKKGCDEPFVHALYGFACSETDAWEEAMKHLALADRRLAAETPKHPVRGLVFMKLGEAAMREQHFEDALAYYRKSLAEYGGAFLPDSRKVRKVIDELEPKVAALKALAAKPASAGGNETDRLFALARTQLKAGNSKEAVRLSSEAVRLKPDSAAVLAAHLGILHEAREFTAVEALAAQVIELCQKQKDGDALAAGMDAFSRALADDLKGYQGANRQEMPERMKQLEADKLSERVMLEYPDDARLAAAHLRIVRDVYCPQFIGHGVRTFQVAMALVPKAVADARKKQQWNVVCDLGRTLVDAFYYADMPGKRKDALRAVSKETLLASCESMVQAATEMRSGKDLALAYRGILWLHGSYGICLGAGTDSVDLPAIDAALARFRDMARKGLIGLDDLQDSEDILSAFLAETGDRKLYDKAGAIASGSLRWPGQDGPYYLAQRFLNRPHYKADTLVAQWTTEILKKHNRESAIGVPARVMPTEDAYARKQVALADCKRQISFASSDAEKRAALTAEVRDTFDEFISTCVGTGRNTEAIEETEWLHGASLRDLFGGRSLDRALEQTASEGTKLEEPAKEVSKQLAQSQAAAPQTAGTSAQRDLKVQAEALSGQIGALAARRQDILTSRSVTALKLAEIQKILAADTTLLFIHAGGIRSNPPCHGFVAAVAADSVKVAHSQDLILPSGNLPFHIPPQKTDPSVTGVQEKCDNFHKAMNACAAGAYGPQERDRFNDASRALYNTLIRPIEGSLTTRNLVIVPSDDLFGIPFGLLMDAQGKYLAERYAVSYAPSATVLKYCLDRHRPLGEKVAVLANPALNDPAYQLKFAEQEAETIRRLRPAADVYLGVAATPDALRKTLLQSDIVHLACHALFDSAHAMNSCLALAPSGGHNGRVSAAEIMTWRTTAQLVVLSACETGRGEVSPGRQEVLGLIRSWMFAGAPSVVASLWKLDDRATSELMGEFYQNLKTMGRAEALQRAQVMMMKKYENPYYWGAFVLYGDYR